ncbi:unnamed protein product [Cylicocyclus nassatus]|uniref:Transthyretin-like family protein n=1 Tax=Cylicocyclus nassatus TaxID=53992 RepID=A0AA36H8R2_CYLNA|nr:unnamed protein product [Cylicocyclus nassatus]
MSVYHNWLGVSKKAFKTRSLLSRQSVFLTAGRMLPLMILSFAGYSLAFLNLGSIQSVAVTGRLFCNGVPDTDVKVKLYDKEITIDDLMDEGKTNETGGFLLHGSKKEVTSIDPKLYIYHSCGRHFCGKLGIRIPDDFVSDGTTPYKTFDIGIINLAGEFSARGKVTTLTGNLLNFDVLQICLEGKLVYSRNSNFKKSIAKAIKERSWHLMSKWTNTGHHNRILSFWFEESNWLCRSSYIYHKCNYKKNCYENLGKTILHDFVTEGPTLNKKFYISTITLADMFTDEELIVQIKYSRETDTYRGI